MKLLYTALLWTLGSTSKINCYERWWPLHFNVVGFTAPQFEIIRQAQESWNTALGGSNLYVWEERDESFFHPLLASNDTQSGATNLAAVYAYDTQTQSGNWVITDVKIKISDKLVGNNLFNTVLHEFGHALGLQHSRDSEVMGWTMTLGVVSPRVSINDRDISDIQEKSIDSWSWWSFFN